MTTPNQIPEPQRLIEQLDSASGRLLRQACRFEPPADSQDRIWRHLTEPAARLAEAAGESAAVVAALRAAADIEPPPEAQQRIWRRLNEEHAVREGAEPQRLVETDDFVARLLSQAAGSEPGFGKQARILRAVREPAARPFRWGLPLGALGAAMATLLVVVHFRGPAQSASQTSVLEPSLALVVPGNADLKVVHSSPVGVGHVSLALGDTLVVGASGTARVKATGVGDIILGQAGTSLQLVQSDEHGVRLALAAGRVSVHADKRNHAAPLVIEAQGVLVQVVGTIFSVETTPQGPHVYVREGLVKVSSADRSDLVGVGQSWPSSEQHFAQWATDAMDTLAGSPIASATAVAAEPIATPDVSPKAETSRFAALWARATASRKTHAAEVTQPQPVSGLMKKTGVLFRGKDDLLKVDPTALGPGDRRELANSLESEGGIRDALAVRTSLVNAPDVAVETRARYLLEALSDAVLLNDAKDARSGIGLVESNFVWLPTEKQQAAALVFESMLYANQGRVAQSDRALRSAISLDGAAIQTASAVLKDFELKRAGNLKPLADALEQLVSELHEIDTSHL